jgi:hypothetical protein
MVVAHEFFDALPITILEVSSINPRFRFSIFTNKEHQNTAQGYREVYVDMTDGKE